MLRNRVPRKEGYDEIVNSDESLKMYQRAAPSRAAFNGLAAVTGLIGLVALAGLITASILAGSNFIKQGSSPTFNNITVSGTVNTTTLLSESIGFGAVDVQNLTTVNHTSTTIATGHLNADNVWVNSVNSTTVSATTVSATNVNSTTVSAETVSATTVSTTTVMTDNVMHNVLSVITNDTMPATHGHVLLEGGAVVVTLPSFPLTDFKGKTFSVCNSDSVERKLVLPDGNYWMPNTEFTQILFNAGQCCVTFSVTDENQVHIVGDVDNKCFMFCSSDGSKCGTCESCKVIETPSTAPPAQDIFDQITLILSDEIGENLITERIVDVKVPVAARDPETYGYNSDGSLNVTGGVVYPSGFEGPMFRVHAGSKSLEKVVTLDGFVAALPVVADVFTSRGFSIPPPDTTSMFNADHFTYRTNRLSPQFLDVPNTLIDMNFIYNGNNPVPEFVDLVAYSYTLASYIGGARPYSFAAAPYEADLENNRVPQFAYPIRIPVTTDCYEYTSMKQSKTPAVYYNDISRQFEIDVQDINFVTVNNTNIQYFFSPVDTISAQYYLEGFSGKFQLIKRDSNNNIVSSSPRLAHGLVQVSETVNIKCKAFVTAFAPAPGILDSSITFNYRSPGDFYGGIVAGKASGGTPDFDIFVLNVGFDNAIASLHDPYVSTFNTTTTGDNPNTIPIEELSGVGNFEFFDSDTWAVNLRVLPVGFIDNPLRPEDYASFPVSTPSTSEDVVRAVSAHEYAHSTQIASIGPIIVSMDLEAQAVGMEMDTAISIGVVSSYRPRRFVQFLSQYARNTLPLLYPNDLSTEPSYGQGIFWQWLAKRHDPAYQIMRRANELLATSILTIANLPGIPDTQFLQGIWYPAQYRLYLKQAATELKGLDFNEVVKEFAISASLIRNNGDIPMAYRTFFPHWTAQSSHPDATTLTANYPADSFWWEELDLNTGNAPSVVEWGYDTVFPQLNATTGNSTEIDMEDLATLIYVVDTDIISGINVTSSLGRIVAMVHQFERNVPDSDGTFTALGPFELAIGDTQSFDMSGFVPQAQGLVRMVITNIEITDFGGPDNVLQGVDRITGKISIDAF